MHFGFVIEQHSGHVTFERLLRAAVDEGGDVAAWHPLPFAPRGGIERLPPLRGNWAARASARARSALTGKSYDALLFHTQAAALLSVGVMKRIPTVISVDATPENFSEVAAAYGHPVGSRATEAAKRAVVRRALRAARVVVPWSEWARRSLLDDYGVDPARIELIRAGTDVARFAPAPGPREPGPPRVLFVATEFERKGGELLLEASPRAAGRWELDVVTPAPVASDVRVHRGLRPGDGRLVALYTRADVFALPTFGDCSPHALIEAMAAGLPVVTTAVGAIPEIVGDAGVVIPPGDLSALTGALDRLTSSPRARERLGAAARARAEAEFDAARNARRLLDVMREVSAGT
jgi:glycosyltransferase involved in cell wall biosynthesis